VVRLIDETGVELPVDGCTVDVGSAGDDDEFGAAGPIGPLVEPVGLASLADDLEQVPVVRIVGAVHEPLDPVDRTGKKPDRREERVDVYGAITGVGPVLESAGPVAVVVAGSSVGGRGRFGKPDAEQHVEGHLCVTGLDDADRGKAVVHEGADRCQRSRVVTVRHCRSFQAGEFLPSQ